MSGLDSAQGGTVGGYRRLGTYLWAIFSGVDGVLIKSCVYIWLPSLVEYIYILLYSKLYQRAVEGRCPRFEVFERALGAEDR